MGLKRPKEAMLRWPLETRIDWGSLDEGTRCRSQKCQAVHTAETAQLMTSLVRFQRQ